VNIPNAQQFEFFHEAATKGTFFKRSMHVWRGKPSYRLTLPGTTTKIVVEPMREKLPYDIDLMEMQAPMWRIFRFYAVRTNFGFFVPEKNLESFGELIDEWSTKFFEFADDVCQNRIAELEKGIGDKYMEISRWVWNNQLQNIGEPPETFVEQFVTPKVTKYSDPSTVRKMFKFSLDPVNPLTGNDEAIVNHLYSRCMDRRKGLWYYLKRSSKKLLESRIGPRKSLVKFLASWKNLVFYEDQKLIELIDEVRSVVMRSVSRDNVVITDHMRLVSEHLSNHKEYKLSF